MSSKKHNLIRLAAMSRVLLICWLLLPQALLAGWEPYAINYTAKDGLPSSECYYVLTDKKGYIWVATDYGISCYNGRKFTNYVDELREKSIILMICDNKNRIWFISSNGVFGYISKGKVHYPKASSKLKNSMTSQEFIVSINHDEEGDFWVGTSLNVFEIKRKNGYSNLNDIYGEPPNCTKSWAAVKNVRPRSWIAGHYNDWSKLPGNYRIKSDLNLVIDKDNQHTRYILPALGRFNARSYFNCITTSRGVNYVAYLNQLIRFTNKDFYVREFDRNDMLHSLYEDKQRNLFITTTNDGVYWYPHGNLTKKREHLLEGMSVGSMTQDRYGGYWFSSTKNGLVYIPNLQFKELKELKNTDVKRIRVIGGDHYFVLTNKRLLKLDQTYKLYFEDEFMKRPTDNPEDIVAFDNKLIYVSGNAGSITGDLKYFEPFYFFDRVTKRHNLFMLIDVEIVDKTTAFGLGIYDLFRFDGKEITKIQQSLSEKSTSICYASKKKQLLIGTRKGMYQLTNNKLIPFQPSFFKDQYITDLKETYSGHLIVGTKTNGIFYHNGSRWLHLTKKDRLLSEYCKEIYTTDNGWIIGLMHGGINYFSVDQPTKIQTLALPQNRLLGEIRCLEINGNEIECGTSQGVFKIPLSKLKNKNSDLTVHLERYQFNGGNTTKKIFRYGPNTFRFYIDILDYEKLHGIDYMSRLKGFNKRWEEGNSEYLEYTNLPPGEYQLQVAPKAGGGQPGNYKTFLTFTVLTPFWQTWWFITLCFIAAVSFITGIIVWRIRIINKREAKRNELLRQIAESQVVALRAQMNPHFIFNAINSIQDFVLQNETEEAYGYLSKFARLIRLVMHQSNNNFLSLEQEIDWLKIYMELEQLRFKGKFDFELVVDPELEMDLQIPNMLIQPHLENAIWHGIMPLRGKRSGKVRLAFLMDGDSLRVEIEDNGVGRENAPEKKGHDSSGIRLVKDRLERLSKLENIEFRQEILDVFNENGEVSGTKVILHVNQMG